MNMNVKNQYCVIQNYTGSSFLVLTQLFKEIHLINDASVMGDSNLELLSALGEQLSRQYIKIH